MKRLSLILFAMILFASGFAQEPEKENKNAVYLTVGSIFIIDISYERMIWNPNRNLLGELRLRGSVGYMSTFYNPGHNARLTVHALSAGEVLRWDFGAGVIIYPEYNYTRPFELSIACSAGMRIYDKSNSLLLRFGIGFPELLYISLGYAF